MNNQSKQRVDQFKVRADERGLTFNGCVIIVSLLVIAGCIGYGAWGDLVAWLA